MEDKDSVRPVSGDAEKGKEESARLQKRVEELSSVLEIKKEQEASLLERLDKVEREKSKISRLADIERNRAEIHKELLDDVTVELEKEKKIREENAADHKEKEAVFLIKTEVLSGENEKLKGEVENLKGEMELKAEEMSGMKRTVDEFESEKKVWKIEKEELKRRLREMEAAKVSTVKGTGEIPTQTEGDSAEILVVPKEEREDGSQLLPHDNQLFALDFMEEDMKYDMNFNMEDRDDKNVDGLGYEMKLGNEITFKEEETPNDDLNSGMGETNMAMDNSFIEPSLNNDFQDLSTPSDSRDQTLAEENSMNDLTSNIEEVDGIAQFEDSQETGERKRRSSRNTSKLVKYNDSMEDSDEGGRPSMKKSKSGKMIEFKRKSKDHVVSANKEKKNDAELDCPECDYRTRFANSLIGHLRYKHNTNLHLAGYALLCECGQESYSNSHNYYCNVAQYTIIRKRDEPIQRLDDKKATPQCILCEVYPKTILGYTTHLRKHHNSTLKENGIYLSCSCGCEIRSDNLGNHSKECNGRQYTLHNLDEK